MAAPLPHFVWDKRFATGIAAVDEQHRRLIDIVNQLSERLHRAAPTSESELQYLFLQLSDYARQHFANEEALMRETGIDPRHEKQHVAHHHQFVDLLVSLWQKRASLRHPAEVLHGFLAAWLSFHILGEDRTMARQLARITAGQDAAAAYEAEPLIGDAQIDALLAALGGLHEALALRDRDLAAANQALEMHIAALARLFAAGQEKC